MKTVYILIGSKGSGKSYIGRLLSERLAIPFLRVEDIFLNTETDNPLKDQDYISRGYINVESEIRHLLTGFDEITIESTGIAAQFGEMVANLRREFDVKLIKVYSDPELCIRRAINRDQSVHIPVSDNLLREINKLSDIILYNFDLIIDNNQKSDYELVTEFIKKFSE